MSTGLQQDFLETRRAHSLLIGVPEMLNASRSTRYSSLSLQEVVCLCADARDNEAWEEFVSRVGTPIRLAVAGTAARWGKTSRAVVEDLVQVTYLKLWDGGCQLLRDFAIQRPEAILAYLRRTAVNTTHDYFKHDHNQTAGGNEPHVSTADVDVEANGANEGSENKMALEVFLREIDEHLKESAGGDDPERDRMIFWLYFRQGLSTREIAELPTIGLTTKGVGSVIERLKQGIREQILLGASKSQLSQKQNASGIRNS